MKSNAPSLRRTALVVFWFWIIVALSVWVALLVALWGV